LFSYETNSFYIFVLAGLSNPKYGQEYEEIVARVAERVSAKAVMVLPISP
jgi:hypothetical protein